MIACWTAHLKEVNSFLWGFPLMSTLLGTGIYYTLRLRFIQIFKLKLALSYLFYKKEDEGKSTGDVSCFASLCTSLASTIGTGNIVGVATAILTGGPGAMFWMWVVAFFGMATKYAESVLAIKYRRINKNGTVDGGPMYYIQNGLHSKWLAKAFALFGVGVAFLGIGTFCQVNSIAVAASFFGITRFSTSLWVTILVAVITLGGIKCIAKVSEKVVPFMTLAYILCAILVIIRNINLLPNALKFIFVGAFNPEAVFGGGVGVTTMKVMQIGVSRGIFCDESGLGSTPIAAAIAKTNSPEKQGLISMTGTFFSMLTCSMTGLVLILVHGATDFFVPHPTLEGATLTAFAFGNGMGYLPLGSYVVNVGIIFFAFTTIIGWNYYGEKCFQYLTGENWVIVYRIIFLVCVTIGPFLKLETIFPIADIVNGLMVIPNLIGLIFLRNVVCRQEKYDACGKVR
ncbi:MAG: sodium:alanine symporter family protein [Puniceicoccales bacterium]|jgi:AGCS family alanine or glycine:cation symporter|nr:sodium:alanine symporter family protein [Puniceicoccales bacterium]